MQITRQADYAIRAVRYLAKQGPNQRSATSTVAQEMKIPPSFLAKIISQLSIAGLLHTSRGARGGAGGAAQHPARPDGNDARPGHWRRSGIDAVSSIDVVSSTAVASSTKASGCLICLAGQPMCIRC